MSSWRKVFPRYFPALRRKCKSIFKMSLLDAFIGGVAAFFSVWVFCLLQVIPFFVAYTVGSALLESRDGAGVERWRVFAVNLFLVSAGFLIFFVIIGMPALPVSKALFANLGLANQFGGVMTGLVALYIAGVFTLERGSMAAKLGSKLFGFLFGASLAFAYKPCVTPSLTYIYGLTQSEKTVATGGALLVSYTLGELFAMGALAALLFWGALKAGGRSIGHAVRLACSVVAIGISVMILTGNMTAYKSFLVGRFVNQPGHIHTITPKGGQATESMDEMDHSGHGMEHDHGH